MSSRFSGQPGFAAARAVIVELEVCTSLVSVSVGVFGCLATYFSMEVWCVCASWFSVLAGFT